MLLSSAARSNKTSATDTKRLYKLTSAPSEGTLTGFTMLDVSCTGDPYLHSLLDMGPKVACDLLPQGNHFGSTLPPLFIAKSVRQEQKAIQVIQDYKYEEIVPNAWTMGGAVRKEVKYF
eukprot:1583248-Amphidinium_carterae.1